MTEGRNTMRTVNSINIMNMMMCCDGGCMCNYMPSSVRSESGFL